MPVNLQGEGHQIPKSMEAGTLRGPKKKNQNVQSMHQVRGMHVKNVVWVFSFFFPPAFLLDFQCVPPSRQLCCSDLNIPAVFIVQEVVSTIAVFSMDALRHVHTYMNMICASGPFYRQYDAFVRYRSQAFLGHWAKSWLDMDFHSAT